MIFARKINKIPEFYTIFDRKMAELYIIIARKIFSQFFFGRGGTCLPWSLPSPTPIKRSKLSRKSTLEQNITSIGKPVAKLRPFFYIYWRWPSATTLDFWNSTIAPLEPRTPQPRTKHHVSLLYTAGYVKTMAVVRHLVRSSKVIYFNLCQSKARMQEERIDLEILAFRCWISWAIPGTFAIKVGGCIKSTEILHIFGPHFFFFFGGGSKFLDLHYKTQPVSHHVAKFHGDRRRDLGERVAKEKISRVKHNTSRNYRFGRPNYIPALTRLSSVLQTNNK